jgi:hypothetical protein
VILSQMRTYPDGTVWLRWLGPVEETPEARTSVPRMTATTNCAACDVDDPHWSHAPVTVPLPRIDLIYECATCGRTTYQGRLGDER